MNKLNFAESMYTLMIGFQNTNRYAPTSEYWSEREWRIGRLPRGEGRKEHFLLASATAYPILTSTPTPTIPIAQEVKPLIEILMATHGQPWTIPLPVEHP